MKPKKVANFIVSTTFLVQAEQYNNLFSNIFFNTCNSNKKY